MIGLCFLPSGIGNVGKHFPHSRFCTSPLSLPLVGAPLIGHLSDRTVIKWRKKRGGVWVPEDRLRATLSGALFLVPLSVLAFGLTTQFVPGPLGLVINLLCLFVNGVGVRLFLSWTLTQLAV